MKKVHSPDRAVQTRQLLIAGILFPLSHMAYASGEEQNAVENLERKVIEMQNQIKELKQKIANDQQKKFRITNQNSDGTDPKKTPENPSTTPIKIGGAVRMNYTLSQFDQNSRNTQGDLKFDTFRLNLDGKIDSVILSAEWRYYDYMQVIHHAWIGYKLTSSWQVKTGVIKVPFGNHPFNSNSYYFSSNFYTGLEDNYQLGLSTKYRHNNWTLDAAFLKNTEPSGFNNRSYSINVIGFDNGYKPDDPNYQRTDARPINTFVGRLSYDADLGEFHLTPGMSLMRGSLYGLSRREGHFTAVAAHLNADWKRWNLKLQATNYDYM